jgi:hypothetical protein
MGWTNAFVHLYFTLTIRCYFISLCFYCCKEVISCVNPPGYIDLNFICFVLTENFRYVTVLPFVIQIVWVNLGYSCSLAETSDVALSN